MNQHMPIMALLLLKHMPHLAPTYKATVLAGACSQFAVSELKGNKENLT
jgi:hypothetical protein